MPVDIKNVLVCDAVDSACVELLQKNGINVAYKLKLPVDELCKEVKNYDAAIVRSDTKITQQVLEAGAGSLKVVGRAGAGVDNIDVPAATKNKVIVLKSNLVSAESLAKCKKGVKVVNVARGGIVDEQAVLDALESGQCGGAAFDVYPEEPPKSEVTKKLIQHPKVVATPHLGASTAEAQVRVAVEVAEQFIALTGKSQVYTSYPGVINREVLANYQ
ncbi:D-3-phosphoglycerate dehydrogenase-like [Musca vetustissima]|uniref:D-3-phosphoglycerate dehydrogenase-like n=1 Tax=Musca vetustissima TaxID=27455 RepID=UPI002AB7E9FA|nr:D-3-phosphoglycerate dehydrogenase-like [Musca vetustissima]